MPFCTKCGKKDTISRKIVSNVCTDCIPCECGNCKLCFDNKKRNTLNPQFNNSNFTTLTIPLNVLNMANLNIRNIPLNNVGVASANNTDQNLSIDVNKPLRELCVGDILNIMKHIVFPVNDKLTIIETSLTNKLVTTENRVTLLENVV